MPFIKSSLTMLALALMAIFSNAQQFPSKPINLVVPFVPGGGTDSIARDIAKLLSEKLDQPVIVENKGGGGGALGANYVAKAPADGHTLLFATSTFVTNASLDDGLPFDADKDFAPVALIGKGPILIVSTKKLGLKTLQEFLAYARKNPQDINFCSAGNGSINHLSGELFKAKTGISMTHIPYKGSGPATIDLIAGRTQIFFSTVPTILPFIKQQSVDLLAVTGHKRLALFPATPSTDEAGIKDLDVSTWWGILAPSGTPKVVVDKLNTSINEVSSKDLIKDRFTSEGANVQLGTAQEFQQTLRKELLMWRGLVKSAGLTLN
ncbi:MAG: tripartite tricarboxylate transporter substrate binding protein [Betaproteobacteria bacterium]